MASIREINEKLQRIRDRAPWGARAAALAMASLMVSEVQRDELSRRSHAPHTPTPSPPGEPPARISGNLRASITIKQGPAGGARSSVAVGGTVPYARIQELGGTAGRGSTLPARPYLRPAKERIEASGALSRTARSRFKSVVIRP